MEIVFILIVILVLVTYFRWIVVALVAILFTIGGGPMAGLIAGFVMYWLLKLAWWWLTYYVLSSIADDPNNQEKK